MSDETRAVPSMSGSGGGVRRELRMLPMAEPKDATLAELATASDGDSGPTAKRVKIVSLGCVENALSAARYQELFSQQEWRVVESVADADVVLVNTCGVSHERAQDSVRAIDRIRVSLREDARLIVTGCLVSIDSELLASNVDAGTEMVSPREPERLEALVGSERRLDEIRVHALPAAYLRPRLRALNVLGSFVRWLGQHRVPVPVRVRRVLSAFERPDWHFVQIAKGCVHACSYCAIRFAKGWVRSERAETIVDEVRRGIEAGHRQIVLAGDDTASYGLDSGTDLGALLEQIVALPGEFDVRIRNMEPMGMLRCMEGLRRAVATGKVRAITVPMQSGSGRILDAMAREYVLEQVMEGLADLRRLCPNLLVLTHILVGFPGETRQDFRATLRMLRSFEFDGVAPDCFSPRRNTVAAASDGQIPWLIRRWRYFVAHVYILWRVYVRAGLSLRWH